MNTLFLQSSPLDGFDDHAARDSCAVVRLTRLAQSAAPA
jgi:hypothetical protein